MPSPSKPVLESTLYATVERWVREKGSCWATGINTGPRVGRIDVVGVRDVGGDLSGRAEVIAVEVKAGRQPFATCAGQAHGYSVMADRCYLADLRDSSTPFTDTEVLIAGRLGIGLLAVRSSGRVREVTTAPPTQPLEELRLQVLSKLGLAECSVCLTIFRTSENKGDWKLIGRSDRKRGREKAVTADKGYVWWLWNAASERDKRARASTYWRRFLCPDCVQGLFATQDGSGE